MENLVYGFSSCFGACFLSGGILAGLSFAVKGLLMVFSDVVGISIVSGEGGEKKW